MDLLSSAFLGLLQGLTEFLPVSSSGHLVLAQSLVPGFRQPGVLFDVLLHLGTLLAVLVFFREDVTRLLRSLAPGGATADRKVVGWLVAGTVPTGLIGVLFRQPLEALFQSPRTAAVMLLVTGVLLWVSEVWGRPRDGFDRIGLPRSLAIGTVQGLAIIPGISRSGSTIAVSTLLGIRGEAAARFSFLLSVPAILGAVVLELPEVGGVTGAQGMVYGVGALVAFASGLVAIRFLMGAIRRGRFRWFALWCWAVGLGYLLLGG